MAEPGAGGLVVARNTKGERTRWRRWARMEAARAYLGSREGDPDGLEYLASEEPRRSRAARGSGIWDHQSRSACEEELARALRRAGVSGFERNVRLGPWELDFLWRREKLVVEVDGFTHLSTHQQVRDRHKEEALREKGYRLLRFTNREVRARPQACVRRIQETLRGT